MTVIEKQASAAQEFSADVWQLFDSGHAYQCTIILCPEVNGYSAHAKRLPGVVSEGESLSEAIENIGDALKEAITYFVESGQSIPWEDAEIDLGDDCLERRILVNV